MKRDAGNINAGFFVDIVKALGFVLSKILQTLLDITKKPSFWWIRWNTL